MKKAFQIFFRDLHRLGRNWVALIVVMGVCIIPSLYAWFNIAANFDPYSSTSGIQIAVANSDVGTENDYTGTLDVGAEIVENLKENHDLGWVFLEENAAIEGVESGKYYAAIIIPKDFSQSLTSAFTGELKRPQIAYYVNEKKNAIAPKITDVGADTILDQVNTTFISTASETVSELMKGALDKISGNMEDAQQNLLSNLEEVSQNLEGYETAVDSLQNTLEKVSQTQELKVILEETSAVATSSEQALGQGKIVWENTRKTTTDFFQNLMENLFQGEDFFSRIGAQASSDASELNGKIQSVNQQIDYMMKNIQEVIELNEQLIAALKELDQKIPGNLATQWISELEADNQRHQQLLEKLQKGNQGLGDASNVMAGAVGDFTVLLGTGQETLSSVRKQFTQETMPAFNGFLDSFSGVSGQLSGILTGIDPSIEQMELLLDSLNQSFKQTETAMVSTGDTINSVLKQLDRMTSDLRALSASERYSDPLSMTQLTSEEIAGFMSSPVTLDTQVFYPVENYGSALGPFYTNLAIWVGGIVLIAIFKLEVDQEKVGSCTPIQQYFGRWLLYVLIGQIQAFIICIGDLYLLKIQCVSPGAFLLAGLAASFVYVNVIYALSITFKHIGKALSVLLVILQIPGSAGTYPIEMTPDFFQALHPLLPFTYGINAMREAIAGIYQFHYLWDLAALAIFVPVSFIIGLGLRPLLLNLNYLFDKKLEATDLMICEEGGTIHEHARLSMVGKILLDREEFQTELMKRTERFEAKYKRRVCGGFLAMGILAVVFLILMFSIDSKMIFLILWIASIICISVYLICLEYFREQLQRQNRLVQMTRSEISNIIKQQCDSPKKS